MNDKPGTHPKHGHRIEKVRNAKFNFFPKRIVHEDLLAFLRADWKGIGHFLVFSLVPADFVHRNVNIPDKI